MGLLNFLKKKDIDVQETFNTVASGVDKLFFTNEEKSDASQKLMDTYIDWYKLTVNENTVKSKTRRYIAVAFVYTFLFLLLSSGIIYIFDITYSDKVMELAKILAPYVGGIIFFYFGYYGIQNVVTSVKNQKK